MKQIQFFKFSELSKDVQLELVRKNYGNLLDHYKDYVLDRWADLFADAISVILEELNLSDNLPDRAFYVSNEGLHFHYDYKTELIAGTVEQSPSIDITSLKEKYENADDSNEFSVERLVKVFINSASSTNETAVAFGKFLYNIENNFKKFFSAISDGAESALATYEDKSYLASLDDYFLFDLYSEKGDLLINNYEIKIDLMKMLDI